MYLLTINVFLFRNIDKVSTKICGSDNFECSLAAQSKLYHNEDHSGSKLEHCNCLDACIYIIYDADIFVNQLETAQNSRYGEF